MCLYMFNHEHVVVHCPASCYVLYAGQCVEPAVYLPSLLMGMAIEWHVLLTCVCSVGYFSQYHIVGTPTLMALNIIDSQRVPKC